MRKRLAFISFSFVVIACLSAGAAEAKNCLTDVDCTAPQICDITQTPHVCIDKSCTSDTDCNGGKCDATKKTCSAPAAGAQAGAGAQNSGDTTVKLVNPLKVATVPELVRNILSTAVGIVGALALLIFIYGGLQWLTSAGEPAKIQAGKDAMKWAAIGLVIIFSSYTLVSFVFKALTG